MAMVIVGLLKDAPQARGVPDEDAQAFAEAAELMSAHGAVEGRIYQDPRRRGYTGPERRAL